MLEMKVTFPGGLRVDAELSGHIVQTDQAKESGGEGTAPEPFDHFLASIGTCAGLYALRFCQVREIPTDGLRVVQTMDIDQTTGRLRSVAIDIELPPGFPDKYVEPVRRAADHCRVKKVILDPPEFRVTAHRPDA